MCFGPSSQQTSIAGQQQQFYSTLQNAFQTQFAGQQNILNSLQKSFAPVLAAGINQYGFSGAEDTAMRSQATSGTAQQYQNAARATNQALATQGGGNSFLPTGGAAQLRAQTANAAAGQQSAEQLGITQAGYQQGRSNYLAAAQGLGGVAQQMDPTAYSGQANSAGTAAYDSAHTNATQSAQGWMQVGKLVGGLAGTALGAAATGGASLAFGAMTPGMISGAFGGPTSAATDNSNSVPDQLSY